MTTTYTTEYASPIGALFLAATDQGLCLIEFPQSRHPAVRGAHWQVRDDHPVLLEATHQLALYFTGNLRDFTLPLVVQGTPFQQQAWQALDSIPYGSTISYAQQAVRIGRPKAVRAVGGANARNPLPIVRPCHRVVGSSGHLTGFGGGMSCKQFLLELEQASA